MNLDRSARSTITEGSPFLAVFRIFSTVKNLKRSLLQPQIENLSALQLTMSKFTVR